MKTYSYDEVTGIVSREINSYRYDTAMLFLDQQIQQANADGDVNLFSLLSLLKSECCQKRGHLTRASEVLDNIVPRHLSGSDIIRYETFRLKIEFQRGNWNAALDFANKLLDKDVNKSNILWRASSLNLLLRNGNKKWGGALSAQHRSLVSDAGFQAANNTLYTQTIPHLVSGIVGSSLNKELSPVKDAGEIYLTSNKDFFTASQLGIRLKSFCQAILVESIVLFDFRNFYDAYFNAILTGLCMHHSGISLFAEGLGEIYNLFKEQYAEIFRIVQLSSQCSSQGFRSRVKKEFSDSFSLLIAAYEDARETYLEIVLTGEKQESLPERKLDQEHTKSGISTDAEPESHVGPFKIGDF